MENGPMKTQSILTANNRLLPNTPKTSYLTTIGMSNKTAPH